MTVRRWLRAVVAILILVVIVAIVRRTPESAPARKKSAPRTARVAESATPSESTLQQSRRRGEVLYYSFSLTTNVRLRMDTRTINVAAAPVPDQEVSVAVAGNVRLAVFETEPLVAVSWRFENVGIRMDGGDPARIARSSREMEREVLVESTPFGEVQRVYLPDDLDREASNFIKSVILLAGFQFPEQPADAWSTVERDMTGRYRAEYRHADDRIIRVKTEYLELFGSAPNSTTRITPGGESWARFDEGRLAEAAVNEHVSLSNPDSGQDIQVRLLGRLALERIDQDSDLGPLRRSGTPTTLGGPGKPIVSEERNRRDLERLTGGRSLDAIVEKFRQLSSGDTDALFKEWQAMSATIALSDDDLRRAAELLTSAETPIGIRLALIDALSDAGTPSSQSALASFIESAADESLRARAATSLGMTARPGAQAEQTLRKAAAEGGELGQAAMLGLGIVAQRSAAEAPARTDAIAAFLVERNRSATTSEARQACLEALGNSGSPRTLEEARGYLQNPDPELRGTAVFALRFVEHPEARQVLEWHRSSDPSPEVRNRAAAALELRRR